MRTLEKDPIADKKHLSACTGSFESNLTVGRAKRMKQARSHSQNTSTDGTSTGISGDSTLTVFPHQVGLEVVLKTDGSIPLVPRNGLRLFDLRQSQERANIAVSEGIRQVASYFESPVEVRQDILYHGPDLELCLDSIRQGDYLFDGMYPGNPPIDQASIVQRLKRTGRVKRLAGRYAYFQMRGHSNYYHWTIESFPRLQLLAPLIETGHLDGIILLSHDHAPHFIGESIRLDYPQLVDYIRKFMRRDYILVDDLHFFVSGGIAANQRLGFGTRVTSSTKVMIEKIPRKIRPGTHIVFVTRSPTRKLVNESNLINYLRLYYEVDVVAGHTLSVAEQRERFSTPKAIVGAHGAGLSNVIYAPAGCKLIEITSSKHLYRTHCYYDTSTLAGCVPFVVLGDRLENTNDIFLDPRHFATIRDIIG